MQAIITKYVGPTNTKPSRIKVTGWLGTKFFNWDCALESDLNHASAAQKWVKHFNEEIDKRYASLGNDKSAFKIIASGSNHDGKGHTFIVK